MHDAFHIDGTAGARAGLKADLRRGIACTFIEPEAKSAHHPLDVDLAGGAENHFQQHFAFDLLFAGFGGVGRLGFECDLDRRLNRRRRCRRAPAWVMAGAVSYSPKPALRTAPRPPLPPGPEPAAAAPSPNPARATPPLFPGCPCRASFLQTNRRSPSSRRSAFLAKRSRTAVRRSDRRSRPPSLAARVSAPRSSRRQSVEPGPERADGRRTLHFNLSCGQHLRLGRLERDRWFDDRGGVTTGAITGGGLLTTSLGLSTTGLGSTGSVSETTRSDRGCASSCTAQGTAITSATKAACAARLPAQRVQSGPPQFDRLKRGELTFAHTDPQPLARLRVETCS